MSTILKRDDPLEMTVAGFKLGKVGVTVDGTPSLEDWQTAMQLVQRCNSASLWWIGDLLKEGEARYGDLASQEDGDGKYDYQTLADAKYVACRIPFSDRSEKLGFLHHKIIAPLSQRRSARRSIASRKISANGCVVLPRKVGAPAGCAARQPTPAARQD